MPARGVLLDPGHRGFLARVVGAEEAPLVAPPPQRQRQHRGDRGAKRERPARRPGQALRAADGQPRRGEQEGQDGGDEQGGASRHVGAAVDAVYDGGQPEHLDRQPQPAQPGCHRGRQGRRFAR